MRAFSLFMASLVVSGVVSVTTVASAQVAYTLTNQAGDSLTVPYKDQPRTSNALVLYSPNYGKATRTNGYGVEAILSPVNPGDNKATTFKVDQLTNVWDCQRKASLSVSVPACGNASIPANGWVVSASDDWRKKLLSFAEAGETFTLSPVWFQSETIPVTVINPDEENNHGACGFPGCRGGNQLVIYSPEHQGDIAADGQKTTGTNEFGFEVTVVNVVVVAREGANSAIPDNGYVVSGHGTKKAWLIANAPIGASIQLGSASTNADQKTLTSIISPATYRDQLVKRYQEIKQTIEQRPDASEKRQALDKQFQQLLFTVDKPLNWGQDKLAAKAAVEALEVLNRQLCSLYPSFSEGAIKGVWHRPTEMTPAAIGQTLDELKSAGLNSVFLETFFHGYTIFPSETYEKYGLPRQNPKFLAAGDLLKHWVDEAHKRDMQVHVWFETFYAGNKQAYDDGTPPEGPILAKCPQWANIQYSALKKNKLTPSTLEAGAFFLDPMNPDAQKFVSEVIDEVVSQYNIDGFQLDYIRYPASFPPDRYSYLHTTWGYTPVARQQFMKLTAFDPFLFTKKGIKTFSNKTGVRTTDGDGSLVIEGQQPQWQQWNDFKTDTITRFVEKTAGRIKQLKPDVLVSAAVFPKLEDSLIRKHQDWATWSQKQWVDFLAPMTLTSAVKVVETNTRRLKQVSSRYSPNNEVKVYSGIFGPFNHNNAEDVLSQIDHARQGGADGFIVFDSAHLTKRMVQAMATAHGPSTGADRRSAVK